MTALLTTGEWNADAWLRAMQRAAPERTFVRDGIDDYDPAAIRYAITWKPPAGLLASLPNLEVVFNLGAGVDGLLADPGLPDVPVVRLVDPNLTARMGEWVVLQVLTHHRRTLAYLAQQQRREWRELDQPMASEVRVGFLGYGVLARHAANLVSALGFEVQAWSRSEKDTDVTLHVGAAGLAPFLGVTDILVVLLPLTAATRGIVDARLIGQLAQDGALGGPVLINAGRGGLQNEADIDAALRSGALKGASLDVFDPEPLAHDSPLWDAPNLVITPHCAAVSDPEAVARYVARQMVAHEAGAPLANVIDRGRGY